MSKESVEILKQTYDAYIGRDLPQVLANYDAEIIFNPAEEAPIRGRDAVRAYMERWEEPWEEYEVEAEEFIDAGDRVLVTVHFKGRGKASGVEIDARTHQVFAMGGGKIVRVDEYTDRDQALEAAGLQE